MILFDGRFLKGVQVQCVCGARTSGQTTPSHTLYPPPLPPASPPSHHNHPFLPRTLLQFVTMGARCLVRENVPAYQKAPGFLSGSGQQKEKVKLNTVVEDGAVKSGD